MRVLRMLTLGFSLLALPSILGLSAAQAAPPAAAATVSDPRTAAELVSAVEATYGNISSLKADFVQVTHSASLGQETRQKGRVSLKKPRKMRWDFVSPQGSTFVTDGSTMWVYSPDSNQVIISSTAKAGQSGMTQLLDDLNQLDELFTVTLVEGAESAARHDYIVELIPKTPSNFKKLRLTFAKKKYTVEQVTMTDPFGNLVDLTFSQVRFNQAIPDSDFAFQIPPGAQVIKTDGM